MKQIIGILVCLPAVAALPARPPHIPMLPPKLVADSAMAAPKDTTGIYKNVTLHGVDVYGNALRHNQVKYSQNAIQVDRNYLQTHFGASLMQSLQGIPGVKAMQIGSGQSKPTIRGLGFNRMAVTEDGIKHEGQQWGDDHGLEIDQFAIDRVEIVKGPAALLYGSDAIGGVINLYSNYVPGRSLQGSVTLFGRTNNESVGLSAKIEGLHNGFFFRANATSIDYADYRVPTDVIQYYSYDIKLKDRRLRNTAGYERDGSITLGYMGYRVRTELKVTDTFSKSGFFANAHGLEVRLSQIDYDRSRRDIDLPNQWVNHLSVKSRTVWQNDRMVVEANLAYQNNLRKEMSEPVSHGYMPQPDGTLERRFNKSTYTAKLGMHLDLSEANTLNAGVSAEYQHNRRGGWGFILPDFETATAGIYVFDKHQFSQALTVNAGLRYDYARTRIHSYRDWFMTPVAGADSVYRQRSADISRHFNSVTWSAGLTYAQGSWILKANVGKSFRVPIPKELGVDGVNYHIFRYERGNAELSPEESYQMDAGIIWKKGRAEVELSPYFNYFPNYIYMNPTPNYYEGLQVYHYTQNRVLRYGFEMRATYRILPCLEAQLQGEYLYARQCSGEKKGYGLPFSPPVSANAELKYTFDRRKPYREGYVSISAHAVGRQDRIVPPEKPTSGYCTIGMTAGKAFRISGKTLKVRLNADNLLNRKYFDHTSYYRLIDVPEPGFNVALMLGMNF